MLCNWAACLFACKQGLEKIYKNYNYPSRMDNITGQAIKKKTVKDAQFFIHGSFEPDALIK